MKRATAVMALLVSAFALGARAETREIDYEGGRDRVSADTAVYIKRL